MTTLAPTALAPALPAASTAPRAAFAGGVTGGPRFLLRLEGALVVAASLVAYAHLGGRWGLFAVLFLLPDLSMLGYLVSHRVGAVAYNAAHSYLAPAALAFAGLAYPALLPLAAIWAAHVGFDRMLGYGLKYASAFGDTHLGRVGRGA
jgi:hypothetical protein